jgi:hypothetical protein
LTEPGNNFAKFLARNIVRHGENPNCSGET